MTDWKKIRAEFISGICYRELAKKYDISFSSIQKRGAKEGWGRLRKKAYLKGEEKAVEQIANKELQRIDVFNAVADKLLKMISDGIDDGSLAAGISSRGFRDVTGALKDIKDIKGIKSDLDIQEQIARIEKLKRDLQKDSGTDKTIRVVIDGDADTFSR